MKKRIMRAVVDADPVELASFEVLTDGRVVAEYQDEVFRNEIETEGVWTLATGLGDAIAWSLFFDALDKAFTNSSFLFLRCERW